MSGICQGYSRHIFSESFGNMSGIFPTYDFVCEAPGPWPWNLGSWARGSYEQLCNMSYIFRDIIWIYVWHIFSDSESIGRMSGICQEYSRHIFSESLGNMSGIFPTYDSGFVCETPGPAPCACCNAMIGPGPVCIQFWGVMGIQCHCSARAATAARPGGRLGD